MREPEASFTFDTATRTLRLTGGLYDTHDVEQLDLSVSAASGGFARDVRLDLSEATFFPSLAVGTLVALRRRAERNGVAVDVVAEPGSLAHRVLTVVRVPVSAPR
ncbi:STAS domain-containing protein [Nocardioides sp. ChNu-153]|uniref:hypothetical protein n=1 Tax=unclassified Nocardioides TaxID=2615069 RepID=UPI002405355D|nr:MULTISPECIES: hypothetical protein [unclassified Nocardioides]MDF9715816.1 STAS domain-containing protein [Nocardioides sp. ChNu-99]MDN7120804.1 STAS domain-containing protein [Nocardioides sp. ChNu-153]